MFVVSHGRMTMNTLPLIEWRFHDENSESWGVWPLFIMVGDASVRDMRQLCSLPRWLFASVCHHGSFPCSRQGAYVLREANWNLRKQSHIVSLQAWFHHTGRENHWESQIIIFKIINWWYFIAPQCRTGDWFSKGGLTCLNCNKQWNRQYCHFFWLTGQESP